MKNKIVFTALVLMCLMGLITTTSASQETRLNIGNGVFLSPPTIYSHYVIWTDDGHGKNLYDLNTNKETYLPDNYEFGSNFNMYGNYIVWLSDGNIAINNLVKNKTTYIGTGDSPSIFGNNVAYVVSGPEDSTIYVYNVVTNKTIPVINLGMDYSNINPIIRGNFVVFGSGGDEIFIYNLNTKQSSIIDFGFFNDFDGNIVVYTKNQNIYMRDISTHKTTEITTDRMSENPKINNNKIVWDDRGNIYMYDIATKKTTQLTKSNYAYNPKIYGNKVVYIDSRRSHLGEDEDLFVYDLTAKLSKPTGIITWTNYYTVSKKIFFNFREDGDMPTSWEWNFGDNSKSFDGWKTTHKYTKAGTYTVSLKVKNAAGSNTITKYITVN